MKRSNTKEYLKNELLVSIVIPAYKAEKSIFKAVNSALEQEHIKEVIVVVDGVFDDTEILLKQITDSRLKVIVFKQNKGAQIARNTGLKEASGEYILFLDSDDYFEKNLINGLVSCFSNTSIDMAFAPNCSILPNEKKTYFYLPPTIDSYNLLVGRILSTLSVGIQCIMWRKSFLNEINGWDESIKRNQDGEIVIRALIKGARISVSSLGAGCSVQHLGDRISKNRTLESFTTQVKIYQNIKKYIENNTLEKMENLKLKAALNYFCINICIGMVEAGFVGKEYDEWQKRIEWKPAHFFLLPKNKAVQAIIFFLFGTKSYKIKKILKKII